MTLDKRALTNHKGALIGRQNDNFFFSISKAPKALIKKNMVYSFLSFVYTCLIWVMRWFMVHVCPVAPSRACLSLTFWLFAITHSIFCVSKNLILYLSSECWTRSYSSKSNGPWWTSRWNWPRRSRHAPGFLSGNKLATRISYQLCLRVPWQCNLALLAL